MTEQEKKRGLRLRLELLALREILDQAIKNFKRKYG